MQTIRFLDVANHSPQLGLLEGDDVYNITSQVPAWTDPVALWDALRALGLSFTDACRALATGSTVSFAALQQDRLLLPPVVAEEIWASGVTYERSRVARNAETQIKDNVYDKVYTAERPELFFKGTYNRLVAPEQPVHLRSDSHWMVPEPEVSLVLSAHGEIVGWTLGNDLSARDIEGVNPLYLPQAKVFTGSCAIGPSLLWNTGEEHPADWVIGLEIERGATVAFSGTVAFSQLRRDVAQLVAYLRHDNAVPPGTVLMTGTGIVPPDDFTLEAGDIISVSVAEIGILRNPVVGS